MSRENACFFDFFRRLKGGLKRNRRKRFLSPDFKILGGGRETFPLFSGIRISGQGNNYLFDIQQGQAKVYSGTCGNQIAGLTVNSTQTDGQAVISVTNTTNASISIIVGVKYSANSVVGQPVPVPGTVHYSFLTKVDAITVNQNANGLDLAPKP